MAMQKKDIKEGAFFFTLAACLAIPSPFALPLFSPYSWEGCDKGLLILFPNTLPGPPHPKREGRDMRRRENRPFPPLNKPELVFGESLPGILEPTTRPPPPPSHLSLTHRRKRHACKLLPNAPQRERETRDMVEEKKVPSPSYTVFPKYIT